MEHPVYVNIRIRPTDRARFFEEYVTPLQAHNAAHRVEFLVGDAEPQVVEGTPASCIHALLRFPSEQAFTNWYEAAEYQPLKAVRNETTDPTVTEMIVLKAYGASA